jgi:hypothetical protein
MTFFFNFGAAEPNGTRDMVWWLCATLFDICKVKDGVGFLKDVKGCECVNRREYA